jgi:hypothetical protein
MVTCGNLTDFISSKLNDKRFIEEKELEFQKIRFTPYNIKNFHDLNEEFKIYRFYKFK